MSTIPDPCPGCGARFNRAMFREHAEGCAAWMPGGVRWRMKWHGNARRRAARAVKGAGR